MINQILISIDSFKGSLSSSRANEAIKNGILSLNKDLKIITIPIGDGGEGTLEALASVIPSKLTKISTVNSENHPIETNIAITKDFVIIESSDIIGLNRLKSAPDAYNDSSKGLGIVIKKALEMSIEEIIIPIGGSAINDLGVGMLYELGARFYNKDKSFEPRGTNDLSKIYSIDFSKMDERLKSKKFTILSDVQNPLCGKDGATFTYGGQKGLKEKDFVKVDNEINRVASIIQNAFNKENIEKSMAGAAGGLGFAFMTIFNADFYNGIEKVLEMIDMESKIKNANLVITGEGKIDRQTYFGKAPIGISNLARKHGKYCFAVTGSNGLVNENYSDAFDYIFDLTNGPMTLEESMKNAEKLIEIQGRQIGRIVGLMNGKL
ncbi:MAG: glycerate kinase [Helcococcus sp.]|nr:glycerate kinase [Helcococcus sp.]